MKSTRAKFVLVAVLVCLFAVSMATFLNYFKYKATVSQTVNSRVLVVADAVDNSVLASMALGLSFTELGMLPDLLERQKNSEPLILGIDVFDPQGKLLYSTDKGRIGQVAPAEWLEAALKMGKNESWLVDEKAQFVTGIALKNNFDLTVGYLSLRYNRKVVDDATSRMASQLLIVALPVLAIAALLAPLALFLLMRGFDGNLRMLSQTISGGAAEAGSGPFAGDATAVQSALHEAEAEIDRIRGKLGAIG